MFFFMMGINNASKPIGRLRNVICPCCGAWSSIEVSVSYTELNLFFIPVFKWNRRYFGEASCCDCILEIQPEKGRAFERGEAITLDPADMQILRRENSRGDQETCPYCGASVQSDARFCSMCGRSLK
ncbi:MAG: hypothetical protein PWQ12_1665 [Clostridiales bacterium]|jgi:hypothetical protein|nr:hypothetical protein [Clostridiales bacterium]